ncbi:MAG: DNA repair protein RecO [Gemmatimonadetes bacterium]|nr:DNA repair protein RecO [Gemmatimonadota bacterium]
MSAVSTRAVVLRGHDYGDSSRILRFYTEAFGVLSVVAHGVRGKSGKGAGVVASFTSGELTAYVRPHRDLHTMKDFAATRARVGLARDTLRFAGASVAAELVLSHAEQEAHEGLFHALEHALDELDAADVTNVPGVVLAGLWTLVEALGFAPQVELCVQCGNPLGPADVGRFDVVAGGVRCPSCADTSTGPRMGPVARLQLAEMLAGAAPAALTHARQHFGLVSDFISYHVVPKPLKSIPFLSSLLPVDVQAVP